jgi:hypothetical protein
MTTVHILLRHSTPALDNDGNAICDDEGRVQFVYAQPEEVDLDALSPRARALAEAVAASPLGSATDVWLESDDRIKDRNPDWAHWYTEEQASQQERRPWRGWAKFKATAPKSAVQYLEEQAAKIPAGWHVYGPTPDQPVPSNTDTAMTMEQVLATLADHGRSIKPSTWRAYVTREQAPQPIRHVGRTPLWDSADIVAFLRQEQPST